MNTRCFNHCLCHLGAWSTVTIEVATRLRMIGRPQIVSESGDSHDKTKNDAFCFALCLTWV